VSRRRKDRSQPVIWEGRVLAWFSCGAASAVMSKLMVEKYGARCEVINNWMEKDEHPDNRRFMLDCEPWIGATIKQIRSAKYSSINEVFEKERYMSGPDGARCTVEMKKVPRFLYRDAADIHCMGYTVDEGDRIELFEQANPELFLEWPLRDAGITKQDCFNILAQAGIRRPEMYELGYSNANCPGCVKVTSPTYWRRVKRTHPEIFDLRVRQSRELGVKLIQITVNKKRGRIFLDELRPWHGRKDKEEAVDCGPFCPPPVN